MEYGTYEEGEIVEQQPQRKTGKQNNVLPFWGNESTMNLNPLILTNIQGSSYFKVNLFKLKTYHEVVDEIYYQVKHLEPWERGSRKTSGQTGMCGGVRGVGAGGIVSSAYCLLYKLYTLKLTRKQVNGLMNHSDSCYIRGLGFMYIRYTQPPADLFDWYEPYLQDEEEIDVKAGGGQSMNIGQMLRLFLTKLEWFATLFPRIPVPIQKQIEKRLGDYAQEHGLNYNEGPVRKPEERFENGREQERTRVRQRDERYGEHSNREREPERDDRRRKEDRYDRDRRDKDKHREKESKSRYSEDRKYQSEDGRREKYDRGYREEEKYERTNREEERYERSHRDEDKYSKHSEEKRKHKKSKHKHRSKSRSRSGDRSERKYR